MTTDATAATDLIGERVHLAGHFQELVTVEGVHPLGSSVELQVRREDGQLDETILSADEVEALLAQLTTQAGPAPLADPHQLRLLELRAREAGGEKEVALARQQAERDLEDLHRARRDRLAGLNRLAIARSGPCATWPASGCCPLVRFWKLNQQLSGPRTPRPAGAWNWPLCE